MKWRYIGKKTEPASVVLLIEDFLKAKGLRVSVTEDLPEDSFKVLGIIETPKGKMIIKIDVSTTTKGLEVDFRSGESEKTLMKFAPLISFVGAGIFLVKISRKVDYYERMERDLDRYLQQKLSSSPSLS